MLLSCLVILCLMYNIFVFIGKQVSVNFIGYFFATIYVLVLLLLRCLLIICMSHYIFVIEYMKHLKERELR